MAPKYKMTEIERIMKAIGTNEEFNDGERLAFYLGARSMARILAGEESGSYRYMTSVIEKGAQR